MAERGQNDGRLTTYLSISGRGYIYRKSNEKEYQEQKKQGLNYIKEIVDEKGQKYYHDIFDGGTSLGNLEFIGIREFEHNGNKIKTLTLVIGGEDFVDSLSMPLLNQKKGLTSPVSLIAKYLPNVDFNKPIAIRASKNKADNGKEYLSIFIENGKDNFIKAFHKPQKEAEGKITGDIPPFKKLEAIDGSVEWDTKEHDKFLLDSLMKQIERFKEFKEQQKNKTQETQQQITQEQTQNQQPLSGDEDDDLPF